MHSNDAQMLVLTVLAAGPLHGYAINTAIEGLTGRKLGPGSLYGALSRLETRGLIRPAAPAGEPSEPGGSGESGAAGADRERHRTMRITDAGRDALRAELEQMARVSQAGLRALRSALA